MAVIKKIVVLLLIVFLVILIAFLIKAYRDVGIAKEYVSFVTDSTNKLIDQFDSINMKLNELEYDEKEDSLLEELRLEQDRINTLISETSNGRSKYEGLYGSSDVEEKFDDYLNEAKALLESYEAISDSIENLEDREVYEEKLEEYVNHSNELQLKSEELESILKQFVQEYTKFDFKRLVNGVKSI